MRTHICIILVSFLISSILLGAAAGQEEQWLQYRSAGDARQFMGDMNSLFKELSSSKPEGVKLPEFTAEQPLFLAWETPMAKSGKVWIAFDKSSKTGQYDRLYLDSNGNGDLSDETAVEPSRRESTQSYFGPVKVVFEGEDGPITYHLNFEFYGRPDRTYCLVAPGGWYEGPITVGGVKKHCVLLDYNVNGTFNDKSPDSGQSDRIRIGAQDSRDTRFVGNYIEVDGKLYRPQIAKDGAFIILKEADDVQYGTVRLANNITAFAVGGENGSFTCQPKETTVKLPVGEYRIERWSIVKDDGKGSKWELQGQYPRGVGGGLTITQEKETPLSIGEPVYSTVTANLSGDSYTFGQTLQGRQGEPIQLLRNGSRSQPPKLHIRNKDGTYDRAMSFEYG